jgi:EAL domain-containing protein (putative c-di-GMP-specific phosphodiesterase class I)
MLDQSARLLRGLQWQDRPLHLSFNMGIVCLEDESFTGRACESVQRLDLPPDRVTLEVTESASMDDAEAVVTSLARLRMRGFDLAVDDFGTGFASLRQFTYGAYSEVKIDRQFVARMGEDRTARAAVLSIAALARGLDMRCVAEGIETAAVREHALRAGCTVGQGWLWSRPIRGADLAAWTAAFQPLA